jgi:hypothetical protein
VLGPSALLLSRARPGLPIPVHAFRQDRTPPARRHAAAGTGSARQNAAGENGTVTESAAGQALPPAERQAAEAVIPDYPALARPGSASVEVPDWWHPRL